MKTITIENTTLCGGNCIMCVREQFTHKLENMQQECFIKIIDELIPTGIEMVGFGGFGDPLMDKGLEEKLKYIKENYPDVKTSITSTCQLLEGSILELVCQYVDVLKISHYGFSKSTFESVHRGSLVYEKVKKNIQDLLKIDKPKRPYVIMSFIDLPENKGEAEPWRDYWEELCDEISIWRPHNWAGIFSEGHTKTGVQDICRSCGRVGNDFVFRTNGDVSVCCFDFNKKLVVGNIMNTSFQDILQEEKLQNIIEIHQYNKYKDSGLICENCDQIFDRTDALLYTSDKEFKVGMTTNSKLKLN